MTCLYLRVSSPEGFPASPREFPGSLPAPETFPGLPLALPWLDLGAPVTPGTAAPSPAATLPPLPRCLRGHTAAAASPVTVSRGEGQRAPRGQRGLGIECSGFPGRMSLPRTDSLKSTKGLWGISRAKGSAAARRGFLGLTPVGLASEIPAAPGTASAGTPAATGCERPLLPVPGGSGGPVLPVGRTCSGSPYENPRSRYSHSGTE